MEKTITFLQKRFLLLGKGVFFLIASSLLFVSESNAQYTQPGHYYGCCYSGSNNRYAAIEDIVIEDQSGNTVFYKSGDGCTSCPNLNSTAGHYNLMTTTSSFTLSAGAEYTFSISTSNPLTSTLQSTAGIWFDFNGDEDFDDAGEFVSPNAWQFSVGALNSFNFTVPCGGTTGEIRMRVRTDYYYYSMTANKHSSDRLSGQVYYGETEDYTCSYSVPSGLSSNFFSPDTVYIGTVSTFVNSNQSGYISHEWTVDGTSNYSTTNAEHIFTTAGTYSEVV